MEIVLLWCFVIGYFAKRGAEDLVHAVKGTPNPRYELKRERAIAAGQRPTQPPRYGGREWFADLMSDAMVAHTEKRRAKAVAKAQPLDDLANAVREPRPVRTPAVVRHETPEPPVPPAPREEPEWLTPDPDETPWSSVVHDDQHPYCLKPCGPTCTAQPRLTANETLAQVIRFPNIKKIEKEITMANAEATGLTTAIAFATAAATAHEEFSTAGSEGYAGSLERMGFGDGITGLAAQAREASGIATEKWKALADAMENFQQGREFYANNPDAPEKVALVNE